MSYRCQNCGARIPPNNPAFRKVVETRAKTYPRRPKTNRFVRQERRIPWPEKWQKEGGFILTDDSGGVGQEVVKEVLVCARCHRG